MDTPAAANNFFVINQKTTSHTRMTKFGFITKHRQLDFDVRRRDAQRQLDRADRGTIPVILDLYGQHRMGLEQHKFAFPADATMASVLGIVRKHAAPPIRETESLTGIVLTFSSEDDVDPKQTLICTSHTLSQVHKTMASNDSNLYIIFCLENVFGCY